MRVKVKDVMTTDVASVHSGTPFKDVAETLISRGVSAVPVVDDKERVVGVVSEADLLHKEEFREQYYREGYQPPLRARLRRRLSEEGGAAARKARTAPPPSRAPSRPRPRRCVRSSRPPPPSVRSVRHTPGAPDGAVALRPPPDGTSAHSPCLPRELG
jgi:FOG: CBS domain